MMRRSEKSKKPNLVGKPSARQSLLKKVVGICLFSIFTIQPGTAMASKDWMKLEVRGLTPTMTFAEVKSHLKKNWPNARLKVKYTQLRHANSRYKFGRSIEFKDHSTSKREYFRIIFLPPENITDDPEAVNIKQLVRNQNIKETPVLREDFINQLTKKYGQPTLTERTKLQWIFDSDRLTLSKDKLSGQKKAIKIRCEQQRQSMDSYIKTTLAGGNRPEDYNERRNEYAKQLKNCYQEQSRIKNCFNHADTKLCPYRMSINWSERSETKGFVPFYAINLYSIKLNELENQRLAKLKQQLMKKALEETKEKAKSGAKLNL